MFDIAADVVRWHEGGQAAALARVVSVAGMSSRWPAGGAARSTSRERSGSVLGGSADPQLLDVLTRAAEGPAPAEVLTLVVADEQAVAAGLACGGSARVLVQPSDDVPAAAWQALAAGEPVALVSDLDGEYVGRTTWFGLDPRSGDGDLSRHSPDVVQLLRRGTASSSEVVLVDGRRVLVDALWPTPHVVVVGGGQLADALVAVAGLLGWTSSVVDGADQAVAAVRGLTPADAVVVLSHDRDVDGPSLVAALSGRAGYVGALGSRRTQEARATWLTEHDLPAARLARLRGPAGLDVGARTPPEIAVAIVAEVLATRAGTAGAPLRDGTGPVNAGGPPGPAGPGPVG